MRINLSNVMVNNQGRALKFYTEILGFTKKSDLSVDEYRWLTVTSPDGPEGIELVLEPMTFPSTWDYQNGLYDAGIPIVAFLFDDLQAEYQKLNQQCVVFRSEHQILGALHRCRLRIPVAT